MQLSKKTQLVQDKLSEQGLLIQVVELNSSTRTAQDAANSIGCEIGQICKSLIFRHREEALLFLVSGKNQLNVDLVQSSIGHKIEKANAKFIKERTGFSIGGVPPCAHASVLRTYIDEDLLGYQYVWAAAGTPNSVFCIESALLPGLTNGLVMKLNA